MFFAPREKMLEGLRKMGSACCGYDIDGTWPDNRCDCKYGGENFRRGDAGGEQTGCPELRSVYSVIEEMSEEEWDRAILASGGVCIEYLNRPPVDDGAKAAAGRLAKGAEELARLLSAMDGAPAPLIEGVIAAQSPLHRLLLETMGFREDAGADPESFRLSDFGLRAIAACREIFPDVDNDVDAALRRAGEALAGGPSAKAR